MYNFFTDKKADGSYIIDGSDYNHVKNVLRMKEGEKFLVSDNGASHLCELSSLEKDFCIAKVIEENYLTTELPVKIRLFQGLPKSDKLELIIQKTVELGVSEIIPVEMARSIVKFDQKKKAQKTERFQAIAESAAKQSKRNVIPTVKDAVSFSEALELAKDSDLILIPYENEKGMQATKDALNKIERGKTISVFIGPEGGFDEKEVEKIIELGGISISLGSRILRTETAAITTLGMLMLHIEMNV